ncbi:hypothetical protein MSG28_004620 [Choristoneura fumiferana]|uniref:Uncharacterized protein n=1 Tax=Choristoneura fumiferana TaxID=7141 RepID=A0ACC0K6R4_CHOFU|nr:hypothetical protein MSG28_004620 [Choristoneura fumiferana]
MIALTEDVYKLFDNVTEEVSRNVRHLMQQLWLNWSHVGVEYDVKVNNIQKLVQIEKDLHSDVLDETKQKLKVMQHQVTDLNMDRLAKLRQDLQEKYDQTNNRVLELRERLSRLWECLDEDQIYRDNFLQAHPGCTPSTEAAIKEEIKRCEQIKRQKIQVFVANMRTKIKLMWDNIMYSSREREEFLHYYQDIFTEDTLTLHEMYLEKITKFYNEHKNIFDLVVTRKNLWLKQAEMDARASEPGRYHNRGGNLLREEKERKAIETNERHNKLSARKQALTPSNPLLRSLATSPLGKRNRTAAGLAHTAERTRRVSGRLATKALVVKAESNGATVKRKLEYGGDTQKTPKANGSILKHKRTSIGKRRSGGRRSNGARNTVSSENARKNPLMETTKLTSYSDFKVRQCKRNSDELQAFMTSPTPSLIPPNKAVYLEADPFDYEIVNIDYNKLRVRKAEVIDVPQIINLIQTLEGKETMWIVENSIMGKKQHQAYVFMSGVTLVGYGIVEPPEQINFIQAKFNLDYYHIGKYHNRGHGASVGFATLKTTLVYPVIHKANTMAIAMVPLLPRKSESICGLIPQLKNLGVFSRKIAGSPYLTFTNVTLVSPSGLPFIRHCKPHVEMMFLRHRTTTDQFLKSTPYTYYLNVVVGTVVDINKSGNIPPYSRLDDPSYREPQINTYYETPDNVFIVNSLTEANKALRFVKNFYYRNNQVIVYGAYLHAYCCIAALLEMEIPARNITFVEPFPPEDPTKPRIPVFSNIYVDQTMREVLNELGISVYRSYYFQSWNVDMYNMATHVNFLSHFQMVELECSAMFYYGVKGIDANAFQAIHRSGMAYDAGILIDHQFRTNDPSIFAAGPSTRYCPRYFAEFKKQKFYDSYEVGEKGYILETFQGGYFKLHLTADSIVDGITCLSPESYSIGHFKNLYGKSAVVLNNVHIKFAKIDDPLPERVCGRDMVVAKETYRTTTGEYCVKPNPNKAMERADCSINCRRVIFMTGVEKRLQGKTITQPTMISETKDTYRGIAKSPLMPPAVTVRGFGPRHKEIWMPLTAKVHRAVYDRIHVKKECHEVAAVFQSETKKKFQVPFALSPLASWSHGEVFDLAPFPPNPYQTNIAPFMYCSDYCHISQGTPPYTVAYWSGLPIVIYGMMTFVAALVTTLVPDTANVSLPDTAAYWSGLPVVIYGATSLVAALVTTLVPDTADVSLPDTRVYWTGLPIVLFGVMSLVAALATLLVPDTEVVQYRCADINDTRGVAKESWNVSKVDDTTTLCGVAETSGVTSGVCGLAKSFASTYWIYIVFEFLEAAFGEIHSPLFMLAIEMVSTKSRVKYTMICTLGFPIGGVLFPLIYWLISYWRTFLRVLYASGLLFILAFFFLDESPRWHLTKGHIEAAVKILNKAAKINKVEIEESLEMLTYEKDDSSNFTTAITDTFKSRALLKSCLACMVWWIVAVFANYGLSINSVSLNGDKYVNYALSAAVQVPSFVITTCLMDKFNRKVVLMWSFVACGVLCVSQPFIPNNLFWLSILMYMMGKLISCMFSEVIYFFTSELFPTYTRNSMHALCSSMVYWPGLPTLLFGVASLIGGLVTIIVPETGKKPLPDTVLQAEALNVLITTMLGIMAVHYLRSAMHMMRCRGVRTLSYAPNGLGRKPLIIIIGLIGAACGLAKSFVNFYWFYVLLEFLEAAIGDPSSPLYMLCTNKSNRIGSHQIANESPRWLLSKGNTEAAVKIIDNASKMNKIEIKENLAMLSYEEDASLDFKTVLVATLKSRTLLKTFFACVTWWITSTFVSHGLSINSVFLKGNKFINYALASVVEIPGNIFAAYLMDKFNRKLPLIFSFVACAVLCAVQPFIPNDLLWLTISIYMVGKLVSTTFFTITYIFTSELFPTYTRNSMHALCSSVGRIGAGLVTILVPDTGDKSLPDTVLQAEALSYTKTDVQGIKLLLIRNDR